MPHDHHTTLPATATTPADVARWVGRLFCVHARLAPRFARPEPYRRVLWYLQGILSETERKNGWHLAEHAGEARPDGMQRLLSQAIWDTEGVRDDLRTYAREQLGTASAIVVIDETSFPKRGSKSAGVGMQYCGTTGRVENCQVGVFLSYVTASGHTLIDRELYLPLDWCEDRERCQAAHIPETVGFQTKPELAMQMLARLGDAGLPIAWVVADTVYGSNLDLRTWLEAHAYPYVLAVACDEPVGIVTPDGVRRRVEVREVATLVLAEQDWQRLSMSEGTKGPRLFDWARVPILHQWQDDGRHWLLHPLRCPLALPCGGCRCQKCAICWRGSAGRRLARPRECWPGRGGDAAIKGGPAIPTRNVVARRAEAACCSPARLAQPARQVPGSAGLPGNRCRLIFPALLARKKGVLRMTLLPLADGARLLGIHAKTLCQWLKTAHLPLAVHPTDARIRCVAHDHLLELARQHGRPLPELSAAPASEASGTPGLAAAPPPPHLGNAAGLAVLAELREQVGHLHTRVATLQQQLTGLALHVLHEHTAGYEQRLQSLEALLSAPLEAVQPSQPMGVAAPLAPCPPAAPRLLPVEVRVRSHVTALIEYGAGGQYVAVCPRLGVLALVAFIAGVV